MSNNKSTKRILASGVFDVLHPGHEYFLSEAKQLGTHLVVIVTSDGHAERTKRIPTTPAAERAQRVADLPMVDETVVGNDPFNLQAALEQTKPDVIALGHDQSFAEQKLTEDARQLGFALTVVRISKHPNHDRSPNDILGTE